MSSHLGREIVRLKTHLLQLSTLVEENLQRAVRAVETRDSELAQEVIMQDTAIDQKEIEVEEECLKILALHQPVAADLRFIVGVLKMNNDLERIGDLAVNMAKRAQWATELFDIDDAFDFQPMWQEVRTMFQSCLEALVSRDAEMARRVCAHDDNVDDYHKHTYERVKNGILENPEKLDFFIHCLSVSRQLERIADHATNIAEDIIYMVEGDIIRHQGKGGNEDDTAAEEELF